MSIASIVLLGLLSLLAAPLYFPRFGGTGPGRMRLGAAVLVVLLGLAALAGVLGATDLGAVGLVLTVIAAAFGGGPVTVAILQSSYDADHPNSDTDVEESPVLHGGAWIGFLERLAISATLLAGWPEGMAVVLAVKGLGRYSELGRSGAAERFILGTFSSALWAAAATGVGVLS